MQGDLEGACQAADLCKYQLQAACAHKYVDHTQGLLNNRIWFSRQNVKAFQILYKDNKGKGKPPSHGRLED